VESERSKTFAQVVSIVVKKVSLIIIIFFASVSLSCSGFLDDVFKVIRDGIKQGVRQAASRGNTHTKGTSPQKRQAQDEQRGVDLYNRGIQLREKGRYREAIIELEKAVSIARTYNNAFGEMNCLLLIGLSYHDLKDDKNALNYFSEVLQIAKRTGDKVRERSAISMLAICYSSLNDYRNAIRYDEQELIWVRKYGTKEEEIAVLDKLSRNSFFMGDVIKAMSYLDQGLELSRVLGNKGLEMEHLAKLGSYHNDLGNISKALHNLERVLELSIELNNKKKEFEYLHLLGQVYSQLGDYTKAKALLEQSLKFQRETKNMIGERVSLLILGHINEAIGEYSVAITYYEQSQKVAQKIYSKWPDIKKQEEPGFLAIPYLLIGNKTKAEEKIKLSKAELYKSLYYLLSDRPKEAISKLPRDELFSYPKELFSIQSKGNLFGIYTVMGLAYEKLGDLKTSRFCLKRAVDIEEKLRDELHEKDRHHFFGSKDYPPLDRLSPYDGLIRVSPPEDSFVYSEAVKMRIFLEQVAGKYERSAFNIPANIKSHDIELNNNLADLLRRQDIALKTNDKEHIVRYEKEIVALREQRDNLVAKLYKEYPQYAVIKYPRPLQLSEIKLNSDEVLIEYAVTDTQTRGWLIKNNRIIKTLSVQVSRKELEKFIDDYRNNLTNPPVSRPVQDSEFNTALGHKLYTILMKEFMSYISDENRIIIVPDKKLGLLPFETLVTNFNKKQEKITNITFLGDYHDIAYYQSASALTMFRILKKDTKPKKALFVLADPVFDITDSRLKRTEERVLIKNENALMQVVEEVGGLSVSRLDKTSLLAENLLEIFKNLGTEYLTGIEANENNLKNKDLSKYRYLVFATHGILDNKVSGIDESALLLSQIESKDWNNNGFLTMSKVMGLKLDCDLVALVACEMASGKLVSGEGVVGMGRAFQYAGAESVIASLWSVAEDSSVKLIERFFYYLHAGKDRASALRMARNEIKQLGYDHPFFWAPFVLIGESK